MPFEGGSFVTLLSRIQDEEPPKSSCLNPAADGVLRRALAKDPAARFESCRAFVAALRDACLRTPAANVETAPTNRRGILVAGGVVACLLVGAGVAWRLRPPGLEPGRQQQKASAIRPSPMVASPAIDHPRVTPPRQAPAASGKEFTAKARPAGMGPNSSTPPVAAPVSPPSRATDTAPASPGVRRQSSGSTESKINPKDGLTYVWIPPGTFQMGCSTADGECPASQKPMRQVTLSRGFWIGQNRGHARSLAADHGDKPE
jgi:formylglycine-generating enzyme required for sulfatase activity